MKRSLIATAVALAATTLSAGAFAQTTSGPSPVMTNPTPVTSGPTPVTSGPTPVTSGPRPVSSGPRPVSSGPRPVSTGPGVATGGRVTTGMPGTLDRDIHQQDRIEQGLQNGQLTTREGSQLERDEARINATQARDMRNGSLSTAERAHLDQMQDRVSQDIHSARDNGMRGNASSASSQRLQADVQRNAMQQTRIENGLHQGQLTGQEAARLEGNQSRTDTREYAAGRDGYIGRYQQNGIQRQDNRRSVGIRAQKHDPQHRRY